jgi:hypothetical protein
MVRNNAAKLVFTLGLKGVEALELREKIEELQRRAGMQRC